MKRAEMVRVKKIIKTVGDFTFYYNSKSEELRITVAEGKNENPNQIDKLEKENLIKVLNVLTENGLRPIYKRDRKTYQGFINRRYIVFY